MTTASRAGERQRPRWQGWLCMLMVSVGTTEPSKEPPVCLRGAEVGAEERHPVLSGCARPKCEELPQPRRLLNPTAANNNDVWFLWQTSGQPMQSVSLALSASPTPHVYLQSISHLQSFFYKHFYPLLLWDGSIKRVIASKCSGFYAPILQALRHMF